MYHSIDIGENNTWEDWHLISKVRPSFNPPKQKKNYISVPGMNGALDLSESLTGFPVYENREGTFEFLIMNDYESWEKLYSKILSEIHGKELKAILEDDSGYYYIGRFEVSSYEAGSEQNSPWSKIGVSYNVDPYKYEISDYDDWEWDTFDFEVGVIREYNEIEIDHRKTVNVYGLDKPDMPSFEVDSTDGNGMTMIFNNEAYHLPDGVSKLLNSYITKGDNYFSFIGYGTVKINYVGGTL